MYQNYLRFGLMAGVGAVVGALTVLAVSRGNNPDLRKACVSLLSQGIELKDKAMAVVETAKENFDDFVAEARHQAETRKVEMPVASDEEADTISEKVATKKMRKSV